MHSASVATRSTVRTARHLPCAAVLFVALSACGVARGAAAPDDAERRKAEHKFFENKVRPLLVESCFSCHGEKKQKGGLRMDTLAATLKGGKNGTVLVPGKPAESPLITAVKYEDEDLQMPPDEKLSDEQIAVLTQWVRMGAPWPDGAGPVAGGPTLVGKVRTITDDDRAFWSFNPLKDAPPPGVTDGEKWARNDVDKFVLAKLTAEGLAPAPEADRATLIRRASFDLHGLPPTPAEIDAFVADPSPDAYEKLIDRLLASPRYGERYARHWLDIARYAESDGFKQDGYRPNAWPYRDYVIKSFNDDKPYDRFVAEQLAGDEIAPGDPDALVATGFLRAGMYEYNQRNARGQWSEHLADMTDVTADAFLGLSMGCARCHDHKFDPILQADYFRLQAFLAPVLPRSDVRLVPVDQRQAYEASVKSYEAKTAKIREQIAAIEMPIRRSAFNFVVGKFPPDVQAFMKKPAAERTPLERQIAYLVERQVEDDVQKLDDKIKGKERDKLIELRAQLGAFDDEKPKPMPTALCVADVGPAAPETTIPGDAAKRTFDPGYLTVLERQPLAMPVPTPTAASTGRRTALAKWLTQPSHPLATRVIANRIWQWHFGKGIVRTASDYGRLGDAPSHPELLDWLARRFVEGGWSFKRAHRLVMTSATYRQASRRAVPEVAKLKDPENRWLWRFNARRLDAEQVRDAVLAASGELQMSPETTGGPSADYTAPRRTVFTKVVRNNRDPMLEVFDVPESFGSVPNRNMTVTATQALLMINGEWTLKRSAAFASRLKREAGGSADNAKLVGEAYRLAYGRPPSDAERTAAAAFLDAPHGVVNAVADASASAVPAAVANVTDPMMNDIPVLQVMPHQGGQAVLVRDGNPADVLRLASPDAGALHPNANAFTIEAFVQLESLYAEANVRVIAAGWDGDQKRPGWSLGVTSEKSKHLPRNLILQLAGKSSESGGGGTFRYEVIPSNFRLELHKTYYVAVAVTPGDTSESGVRFHVKDVTDMDAPLRTAAVKHAVTDPLTGAAPLTIGGRLGQGSHAWDGLLGEVRLSSVALKPEQLLWNEGAAKDATFGHWQFEERPGFLKDASGGGRDLSRAASSPGSVQPQATKSAAAAKSAWAKPGPALKVSEGLIDFCHALLNSNEFLYVD